MLAKLTMMCARTDRHLLTQLAFTTLAFGSRDPGSFAANRKRFTASPYSKDEATVSPETITYLSLHYFAILLVLVSDAWLLE